MAAMIPTSRIVGLERERDPVGVPGLRHALEVEAQIAPITDWTEQRWRLRP